MDDPNPRNGRSIELELRQALQDRERADHEVRKAITSLLEQLDDVDRQHAVAIALIRERVSRIRYATALQAAGWTVPAGLLDDVPEE